MHIIHLKCELIELTTLNNCSYFSFETPLVDDELAGTVM